ncbi:hypothetical protein NUW54_g6764 [Trametes sanguinea]|uniref:Uncharacterized protein n=1 Tax=Trametes sanguinea TaxID=158606 RepID=A0ACC1PRE4_9APHY|nr:hypothetical protein NUW54_g6764 [Trametes sanguinea]
MCVRDEQVGDEGEDEGEERGEERLGAMDSSDATATAPSQTQLSSAQPILTQSCTRPRLRLVRHDALPFRPLPPSPSQPDVLRLLPHPRSLSSSSNKQPLRNTTPRDDVTA